MGTGAFSSVSADRDLVIDVAEDAEAFLAITEGNGADSEYFGTQEDGQFYLDFTSTEKGGNGLNKNAQTIMRDVFNIDNQGTQKVYVWFEDLPDGMSIGTDNNPNGDDTNLTVGDQEKDGLPDHPEPEKIALEAGESHEEGWVLFGRDFDYSEFAGEENEPVTLTLNAKTASEVE